MDVHNLYSSLPERTANEILDVLAEGPYTRIERIVSTGQSSPPGFWYDQDEHEWVVVLRGAASLEIEGRPPVRLEPGDHLLLPAHCRHRVLSTSADEPTVWLAVFFAAQ